MKLSIVLGRVVAVVGFVLVACCSSSPLFGHMVFKKAMDKEYEQVKVTCNGCHVKGEKKDVRNDLGKLFYAETESENLTEQWQEKKGSERKAFEQEVMLPAFTSALEVVKEKKNEDGETYDELIKSGKLDGFSLKD